MFVQRLTHWTRRLFAPHPAPTQAAPTSRQDNAAVMSGCAAGEHGHRRGAASSGSWLADARVLRPRPTGRGAQESRWSVRGSVPRQQQPSPADPPSQPRQPIPSRPVPAHPAADIPAADATAARLQPPQPAPPSQPARLTPASVGDRAESNERDHRDEGDDASIQDQALYRRLMSLRRLVRLGVYGEGFDPRHVPDQYLHSLGRDDSFDAGWDELPDE